VCGLYTSPAARDRQAAAFLAEGLDTGSDCFLVAEPPVRHRVLARLARQRPSARLAVKTGRLRVSGYAAAAGAQLALWKAWMAEAARAGARSMRVVGDVSGGSLARRPFDQVLEYERRYDRVIARRFPVATLCLHDARALSGVEAWHLLETHDDVFRPRSTGRGT
jgi:hypothetical protein